MKAVPSKKTPPEGIRELALPDHLFARRGTVPSIELNVDGQDEGETGSLFGFGTDQNFKAAFGNRFTLTSDQTPFALKQAAGLLVEGTTGAGFDVGQDVGITVLVDATSSGDINNAVTVLNDTFVLVELGLVAIDLPQPVIVQQGDVYIIFTDLDDDDEDTLIPIMLPANGGNPGGRAFANLTLDTPDPTETSAYIQLTQPILGNCIVRGYGDLALPTDHVTGGGEPFDGGLPVPTGLSADDSTAVSLAWSPPALPPPPTPVDYTEAEPNDGPATAQNVAPNAMVSGGASSNDGGSPGGGGADDVEDWYAFTLTEATTVEIDLTGFGEADFDLFLYGAAGPFTIDDAIAVSADPAGAEEHITVAILPAGSYRIAVSAYDPDVPVTTSYTLEVFAGKKANRYNVYRGATPDFAPSAASFFATLPGATPAFNVLENSPGAYYRVTAVVGSLQTLGSNVANTGPDTSPPLVLCPLTIVVPLPMGQCSTQVSYPTPEVSDNHPGASVACVPASGSTLGAGTTTVTCTATDVAGNMSQCSFPLVVADTQAPAVSCPGNIQTTALTSGGRAVDFPVPAATDNCSASVSCLPPSGSTFAVGATTVTCTATDAAGNASTCQFTVNVGPIGSDTVGVYVPTSGSWFLRNMNSSGAANVVFGYGPANLGWIALRGDWDGNGTDTVGLYDPASGNFFLKNTNAAGGADLVYGFGPAGLGWRPLVGDWDGNGVDTVGLYDAAAGFFFLRNVHAPGPADLVYGFGPASAGWLPLIGDWDGNGTDTVGLYAPTTGNFFLRNSHAAGGADLVYGFGSAEIGWRPLAGDWNGDGADTIGLYSPANGFFFLRNAHAPGPADLSFGYGPASSTAILGDWNGL